MSTMRGLTNFIKEVRDCPNKQAERERVKTELNKFRLVFNSAQQMGSYQRKKYVCKILYIFMLGYSVDIGRKEAVQLCSAKKFQEKQIGYLAVGVLLHEGHELIDTLIDILRKDLESNSYEVQALAVAAIANIGGRRLSQTFGETIASILMSQHSTTILKKKASLCLLRIFRQHPDLVTPEFLIVKLKQLLDMFHLGLLTSVVSLLMGMVEIATELVDYAEFVPKVLEILDRVVVNYKPSNKTQHYEYYGVANPWLQVTLLRFLSYFPIPEEENLRLRWVSVVTHLLHEKRVQAGDTSRYLASKNAVLMEVFVLAAKLGTANEVKRTVSLLNEFLNSDSHTMKVLALNKLYEILLTSAIVRQIAAHHHKNILLMLQAADGYVRIRAVEVLSLLCNDVNINEITQEYLKVLSSNDHTSAPIVVQKLLQIAEEAIDTNPQWYVEVFVRALSLAGDRIPETNCLRFLQTVQSNVALQPYAARLLIQFTADPSATKFNDSLSLVSAIIIRNYGAQIAAESGCGPVEQFTTVSLQFSNRSPAVKREIFETLKVLHGNYNSLHSTVENFFRSYANELENLQTIDTTEDRVNYASAPVHTLPANSPFAPPDTDEFRELCAASQGVLFQNDHLQIGLTLALESSMCTVTLYYGNLTSVVVDSINVAVNNPDMNALVFNAQQPPTVLQPQEQASQQVLVTCCKEFIGAPQLNLAYLTGGVQYAVSCHLPVIATSFTTPFVVSAEDFLIAWNQITGPPQEHSVMWTTARGIDLARVTQDLESMHFALISGVDSSVNNRVGACSFHTASQKIPALVRLESDPNTNMFRATVKSFSPLLSVSLAETVKFTVG